MKAIIHIGTEKTGTTTIQEFCHINRYRLTEQGLAFLSSPGKRNHFKLAICCMDDNHIDNLSKLVGVASINERKEFQNTLKNNLIKEVNNLDEHISTVLISSELFHSRLISEKEVKNLYKLLEPMFSEIQIIIYLRRQDKVAVSRYSTLCRSGELATSVIDSTITSKENYYNYFNLVEKWAGIFGRQNLIIRIFDKDNFVDGDLLKDFMYYTGLSYNDSLSFPQNKNENLSAPVQKVVQEFNTILPHWNKDDTPNRFNINLKRTIIQELELKYEGKECIPTRDEAIRFYELFADSNQKLAKKYLSKNELFSLDFSIYPEVQNDDKLNEDIYSNILSHISNSVHNEFVTPLLKLDKGKNMKRKIYIHIGAHKTGTTSIQQVMIDNRELLNKYGLSYFYETMDGSKRSPRHIGSWFKNFPNVKIDNGFELLQKDVLIKKASSLPGDIIISSESFSFVFEKNEIIELKKELDKHFDEIIIITYLRRQDAQIISHHQQTSKGINLPARFFYGDELSALPSEEEHHRLYLDYNKRLSMWADVFEKDNMIIRLFEAQHLYKGDAVADFFHILGIGNAPSIRLNESTGFEKTKISLLMNSLSIKGHLRKVVSNSLDNSGKLLPARESAKELYKSYRESNIRLNKKFNISETESLFNEDFSMYPIHGADEWNEKSANQAITNILKSIDTTYGQINVNKLRSVALKLKSIDIALSDELMQLANQLKLYYPNKSQQPKK